MNRKQMIEEMCNDIGPEMEIEHNGQKRSCIFYSKQSLAEILVARGWVKPPRDSVILTKEQAATITKYLGIISLSRGDENV